MIETKNQELDTVYEKSTDFQQLWSKKSPTFISIKPDEKTNKLTEKRVYQKIKQKNNQY